MKIATLFVGMCMTMLISSVSAQTTISYEIGSRTGFETTEISFSDSLPLFDSNLGVLTGATLTLFEGVRTSVNVENLSSQSQSFRLTGFTYLTWSSNDSIVDDLIKGPQGPGDSFYLSTGSSQLTTLGAGLSTTVGPLVGSDEHVIDLAGYLSAFQAAGGGLFNLSASTLSGLSVSGGGGNITTAQSTDAAVHAMITYTYEVIPEPSSALLGFTVGGLALLRRRR